MSAAAAVATPVNAGRRFTFDNKFQTKIVRTLFQDSDFAYMLGAHLDPELFTSRVDTWVVSRIFEYAEKYGSQISEEALANQAERAVDKQFFRDDDEIDVLVETLAKISAPVPDMSYIKDEVFNFVKAMKLKEALLEAVEERENNDLSKADQALHKYLNFSETPQGLGHFYLRDVEKRIRRRKHFTLNGIPTDTPLDKYMQPGGLPPKQLGVVIAPPNRGKTLALVHFARAAVINNCQALYVTLEMSEDAITDRLDAAFSSLYIAQLKSHRRETRKAVARMQRKFKEALIIKEFPPQSLSVAGLRSYLRQLERTAFYPDLILIDYADLMLPSKHYEDAYDELGVIYQDIRKLAIESNLAIWTASQGNRGSVNAKVVDLASLADSFKKAAICDVAIGLSQTDKEKRMKQARLYMAKNRNGTSGLEVAVKIEGAKQRIVSAGGAP